MKRFLLLLAITMGLSGPVQAESLQVVGILFTADWCHNCKVLKPKLEAVKKEFEGRPIAFERVDLTNSTTRSASMNEMREKGFGLAARRYGKATAHMVLVSTETKAVLGRIFSGFSKAEIRMEFNEALALFTQR